MRPAFIDIKGAIMYVRAFAYLVFGISIFAVLFAVCSGCAGAEERGRASEQDRIVAITVLCPDGRVAMGSGVAITNDHVLTAQHVVACGGLIAVEQVVHGAKWLAALDVEWVDDDLARLRVAGDLHVPRVQIAAARTGDRICVATAWPSSWYRCGDVSWPRAEPPEVVFNDFIQPGNSGSGMYDVHGRLVAITTVLLRGWNGQIIGGAGTRLDNRRWVLP